MKMVGAPKNPADERHDGDQEHGRQNKAFHGGVVKRSRASSHAAPPGRRVPAVQNPRPAAPRGLRFEPPSPNGHSPDRKYATPPFPPRPLPGSFRAKRLGRAPTAGSERRVPPPVPPPPRHRKPANSIRSCHIRTRSA